MTIRHLHMGCGEALSSPWLKVLIKPVEQRSSQQRRNQKLGKRKGANG